MKALTWNEDWGSVTGGYEALVDSMEFETLLALDDRDYQGDSYVLLRNAGGQVGVLIYGWGSCSGCDALQACRTLDDAVQLRDQLADSIHWEDTPAALLVWIAGKDWDLEWVGSRSEHKRFLIEASTRLATLAWGDEDDD